MRDAIKPTQKTASWFRAMFARAATLGQPDFASFLEYHQLDLTSNWKFAQSIFSAAVDHDLLGESIVEKEDEELFILSCRRLIRKSNNRSLIKQIKTSPTGKLGTKSESDQATASLLVSELIAHHLAGRITAEVFNECVAVFEKDSNATTTKGNLPIERLATKISQIRNGTINTPLPL